MKYSIFAGYDHHKDIPLYQVRGLDNEYIGEWHTDKKEADKENQGLQVSFENYTELPAAVQRLISRLTDEQIEPQEFKIFLAKLEGLGFTCERSMCGGLYDLAIYIPENITTVYIHHDLEIPKISSPTIAAVKEWFTAMQKQAVQFDMRYQNAHEFVASDSLQADPETELTYDQAGFINSEIQLAKAICKKSGWSFDKLYNYHKPIAGMYTEVYPMIWIGGGDAVLCQREHGREPDFYDLMVRGDTLEHIYYELDDIPPRHIEKAISAACSRFDCDFDVIEV